MQQNDVTLAFYCPIDGVRSDELPLRSQEIFRINVHAQRDIAERCRHEQRLDTIDRLWFQVFRIWRSKQHSSDAERRFKQSLRRIQLHFQLLDSDLGGIDVSERMVAYV